MVVAGCSGAGPAETRLESTAPVTAEGTATTGATLEPKAILAATKRSVAYVTNPAGSGSGVLLPSGYVVTNAHVVQPFAEVTLTFADGPTLDRVPVLGVDAWTDIAVLGPVTVDGPTLPVDDAAGLEQGDRVYLIGYPDETEKRPTPTITQGLVSRIRSNADYGVTYLQTDATIAGGQSGGALVDGPTLPVDDAAGLEQGDRVYLIGYPDETEKRPTPTITQGLVSRIRSNADYGVTYLQTDATIAGGQSGGALVDGRGRVVGISGYSLDGFGIALRANEVAASVQRIIDGKGSAYRTFPGGTGAVSKGTIKVDARTPIGELYLPPAAQERKLTLKLSDASAPFQSYDTLDGTMYATNGLAEAEYLNALPAERQAEERGQLAIVAPGADGSYTFTVAADGQAIVTVGPYKDTGAHEITFDVNLAMHLVEGLDTLAPLTLGAKVEGVLNSFDSQRGYSLDMRKGQTIDLALAAPMGLLALSIDGPGVDPTGDTPGSFTETDETPFEGSMADAKFTAPADGTYRVYVICEDDALVGYRLTVR